jgi:hypothetical protein
MYQIDTSTGYSLPSIEQIGYPGIAQLLIADGHFSPARLIGNSQNQPTLSRPQGHKVVR